MAYKGSIDPLKPEIRQRWVHVIGQQYTRITIRELLGVKPKGGQIVILGECACNGNTAPYLLHSITRGVTHSCGCYRKAKQIELHTKHSNSSSPEYAALRNAVKRCYNPQHPSYPDYGGRGVIISQRYYEGIYPNGTYRVDNLIADIGPRPNNSASWQGRRAEYSLDRYPNPASNYEPGNLRWATDAEQHSTRRKPIRNSEHNKIRAQRDIAISVIKRLVSESSPQLKEELCRFDPSWTILYEMPLSIWELSSLTS